MVVKCEEVWHEVSNYLNGDVTSDLRRAIEDHVRGCQRCTAVVDGTRNVIQLYGDERLLELPLGYRERLRQRLDEAMPRSRRSFLGWVVSAATAVLVLGSFEVGRSSAFRGTGLRSEHAQPGNGVPPQMAVVVAEDGRLFHLAACTFIHIHEKNKRRTMTVAEATGEGYTPCIRCLKKYLETT
jgi:Putative zinc-finger